MITHELCNHRIKSYGFFFLFQAEILENVYTDCTRLDEALKRGEALHAKEADSSEAVHSQPSEYCEYSSAENTQATETDWNSDNYYSQTGYYSYDCSQAWDYSQYYQTDDSCSTKDPYREILASSAKDNSEASNSSRTKVRSWINGYVSMPGNAPLANELSSDEGSIETQLHVKESTVS